jgi:hypothetical protein
MKPKRSPAFVPFRAWLIVNPHGPIRTPYGGYYLYTHERVSLLAPDETHVEVEVRPVRRRVKP